MSSGESVYSKEAVIKEASKLACVLFFLEKTKDIELIFFQEYLKISSAGQAVVMTYPLIGNYGICKV